MDRLLAASEALELLDPAVAAVARAWQGALPWPTPGQTVWQDVDTPGQRPVPAVVQLSFRGADERVWCLLEVGTGKEVRYVTRPLLALSPTLEGPAYFKQAMKEPEFARHFLQRAGILDEKGKLTEAYRGEVS